jgi:hypothetical protein
VLWRPWVLAGLLFAVASSAPTAAQAASTPAYTEHPPILIESDQDFLLPGRGWTGGVGTKDLPYMISGWEIDVSKTTPGIPMKKGTGIAISNTTAYVVILDVKMTGDSSDAFGVYLSNAPNVRMQGLEVTGFKGGVSASSSARVEAKDLKMSLRGGVAVDLRESGGARLSNVNASGAGVGLRVVKSENVEARSIDVLYTAELPFYSLLVSESGGFLIDRARFASPFNYLWVGDAPGARFSGLVSDSRSTWIQMSGSRDAVIANSTMPGLSFLSASSPGLRIENSTFKQSRSSLDIQLSGTKGAILRGIQLEGCSSGVLIQSDNVLVEDSTFARCHTAINILATNTTVRRNHFEANEAYAVIVSAHAEKVRLQQNTFHMNRPADVLVAGRPQDVVIEGSPDINVQRRTFAGAPGPDALGVLALVALAALLVRRRSGTMAPQRE